MEQAAGTGADLKLVQAGSELGLDDVRRRPWALVGAYSVAVSADGKSAYVASYDSDAVARFNRAP